ncbi:MAG: HIRAN domain-containing protein [bacterium]|nr:HIRAN domain-containing protein [bacterium]
MDESIDKTICRRDFLGALLATPLLVGLSAGTVAAQPAARETIPLCRCLVAGFQYHQGPTMLPQLAVGQALVLQREPANPYDALAIAVHTQTGTKLGYLPRRLNEIPANLMDGGRHLTASITTLTAKAPTWEMVELELYFG